MSNKIKGTLLAVIGAGLWGILGLPVRIITEHGLGAVEIAFVRCLVAGLFYFLFVWVTARDKLQFSIPAVLHGVLYGLVVYGMTFTAYNFSIAHIPVAVSTTLMFLCPIWVILVNRLIFGIRTAASKKASVLVCILGTALVSKLFSNGSIELDILGVLTGIFNGIGVALRILVPQYYAGRYSNETLQVYGFLGSAFVLGLLADMPEIPGVLSGPSFWEVLAAFIVSSVLCTLVANVLFVKSGFYLSSTESSVLSSVEIIVGSMMGLAIYKESLSLSQLCGMVMVVGGAILSQVERKRKPAGPSACTSHPAQ